MEFEVLCREVLPKVMLRVEKEDSVQKQWMHSDLVEDRRENKGDQDGKYPERELA